MFDFFIGLLSDTSRYFSAGEYIAAFWMGFLALGLLVLAALLAFFVFWLCFNRNTYSEEKTAKGKVVKTSFVPEHGGTHVSPVIGMNGNVSTIVSSDYEEEQDIVVLKCEEIGRLELDNQELFESVEKGDKVTVTYREKYTHWAWDPSTKTFDDYEPLVVKTKDGTEIEL